MTAYKRTKWLLGPTYSINTGPALVKDKDKRVGVLPNKHYQVSVGKIKTRIISFFKVKKAVQIL